MPRSAILLALAISLVASARPGAAQRPLVTRTLDSGTVVRLWFGGEPVTARLLAPFGPDSFTFRYCPLQSGPCGPEPDPLRVVRPAADISLLEVRRRGEAATGFFVGAMVGVLGGMTVGRDVMECGGGGCDPRVLTFAATALFGMLGALIAESAGAWGPAS